MTKTEWLEQNNFNKDGFTYIIGGGNTYSIKEILKEQGCIFSPLLLWHAKTEISVPTGYFVMEFHYTDLGKWNSKEEKVFYFSNVKEIITKKEHEMRGPSLSEYVGEINERIIDIPASLYRKGQFTNRWGLSYVYTFVSEDNNIFTWFTKVNLSDITIGNSIVLSGTVKDHKEYNGDKTTILKRCVVERVF